MRGERREKKVEERGEKGERESRERRERETTWVPLIVFVIILASCDLSRNWFFFPVVCCKRWLSRIFQAEETVQEENRDRVRWTDQRL